jgi:hypothetical protein
VGQTHLSTPPNGVVGIDWLETPATGGLDFVCGSGPKPAWQPNIACYGPQGRFGIGASAANGPVWTFNTLGTAPGWSVFTDSVVSSALVAGIFAQTGNAAGGTSYPHNHPSAFYDVTSGTAGTCGALCTATPGFDPPTGFGTPNGYAMAGISQKPFFIGTPNLYRGTPEVVIPAGRTQQQVVVSTGTTTWASDTTLKLSISGLPAGVTGSFGPIYNGDPPGHRYPWADIILTAQPNASQMRSTAIVTGTANGVTYQTEFEVIVGPPCVATDSCASRGLRCGTMIDSCGSSIRCGSCGSGYVCSDGLCESKDSNPTPNPGCGVKGKPACE